MPGKVEESVPKPYYTADMARAMPDDGNRYEVVYGELLVSPAPRLWHQQLVKRLLVKLETYLEAQGVGVVLASPADISWGPDVLVQPDVFVIPRDEARTGDWGRVRTLLLVAEVLSPSNPGHDRFTKRHRYQQAGVPLYWIIDGEGRQAEVWTPADTFPRTERDRLVWSPEGAGAAFTLEMEELFRPL